MYRLKVKIGNKRWKIGIRIYDTYKKALNRQDELKGLGIEYIIIKA